MNEKSLWIILRFLVLLLIAIHGWTRLILGTSPNFGEWLNTQGFAPVGLYIAWFITGFEIIGTILLAINRFVPYLCLAFAGIYTIGIILVHAPAGWFVVGHGRNGAEFSVLLIGCLLLVGLQSYFESKDF